MTSHWPRLRNAVSSRLQLVLLVAALGIPTTAAASVQSDWSDFRAHYPYHAQVIAFSQPASDGSRTIIISEPPPHVTFDDIKSRYGSVIRSLAIRTQQIGYDGWVKDVVGVIAPMTDAERQTLVESISRDFFGTAYKAYSVDLTTVTSASGGFDLSVSSAALRDWLGLNPISQSSGAATLHVLAWIVGITSLFVLIRRRKLPALTVLTLTAGLWYWTLPAPPSGAAGPLHPIHGGMPVYLRDLLASPQPGVFMSDTDGMVVLLLQRDRPLNDMSISLREFALDSDLVLGAVGSDAAIAVLGRERETPVTLLPPLRIETMLQLAAAGTSELSQSYERTNLFAGSTGEEHRDWAPIYLSPQLYDSEYGSLLNITDQLLKSWSEHGEIEYINFPYPKPHEFPFETGLLEHAKTNVVTYNWNTKGVGYTDNENGYDTVAFSRTGALPVDYLGDKDARMRADEEQGYEYFAGKTHDPNLARVVQYASLYQIWRHFGISAMWNPLQRRHEGADTLVPMAAALVNSLNDADVQALSKELTDAEELATDEDVKRTLDDFDEIRQATAGAIEEYGDDFVDEIAHAVVRPRDIPDAPTELQKEALILARAISQNEFIRLLTKGAAARAALLYSSAENEEDPPGWIKTPSIVLSWQTGKNAGNGEGGHNLNSEISRFAADASLTPGKVRIAEEGGKRIVYYHPGDEAKIQRAVRPFARNQEKTLEELQSTVESELEHAPVENTLMADALHLSDRAPTLGRGFVSSPGVSLTTRAPWVQGGSVPASHSAVLANIKEAAIFPIVIERSNSGYVISRFGQRNVIEAADVSGALDAVVASARAESGGRTVHLHFKGVDEAQATSFTQVAEMHGADAKKVVVRTSVEVDADSVKVLGEIRNGRWDLGRAEVKPFNVTEGSVVKELDFDVAVPDRMNSGTLRLRIKVAFSNGMRATAEFIAELTKSLQSAIAAIVQTGQDIDMLLASRRIIMHVRTSHESVVNVRIRVAGQAGEIDVVRNDVAAPAAARG